MTDMERITKDVLQVLMAIVVGAIFCMAAVLVFAFVVKIAQLPSEVILPITRAIKAAGIFAGIMALISGSGSLIKGVISGIGMVFITYIIFSMISGEFCWDWTNWLELLFGGMIGGVSGGICAVVKKD